MISTIDGIVVGGSYRLHHTLTSRIAGGESIPVDLSGALEIRFDVRDGDAIAWSRSMERATTGDAWTSAGVEFASDGEDGRIVTSFDTQLEVGRFSARYFVRWPDGLGPQEMGDALFWPRSHPLVFEVQNP
jgi:hypothetical protein